MTAGSFREILRRRPFEPLRIVMSSGESYTVLHPEMVLVTSRMLVIAIPNSNAPEREQLAFCSYLHIAHIEMLKATAAA